MIACGAEAPAGAHRLRGYRAVRHRRVSMRAIPERLFVVAVVLLAAVLPAGVVQAQKKTVVVALNQDPDILDPTLARTYVGRIVFAHICEKLYEVDEQSQIHPQ